MSELKYCKFCDKEKPVKDFCKSGFAIKNVCKECQNKKQTQIYKNSKEVSKLQKENKQLNDNWKKIKEYIKQEGFEINTIEYGSIDVIDKYAIIEKMQELERGVSDEN